MALAGMAALPLLGLLHVADVSDKQVCLLLGHEVPDESDSTRLCPLLAGELSAAPLPSAAPGSHGIAGGASRIQPEIEVLSTCVQLFRSPQRCVFCFKIRLY